MPLALTRRTQENSDTSAGVTVRSDSERCDFIQQNIGVQKRVCGHVWIANHHHWQNKRAAGARGEAAGGRVPPRSRSGTLGGKRRVTHIEEGFDFLGQNLRRYSDGKLLIKTISQEHPCFSGESPASRQESAGYSNLATDHKAQLDHTQLGNVSRPCV